MIFSPKLFIFLSTTFFIGFATHQKRKIGSWHFIVHFTDRNESRNIRCIFIGPIFDMAWNLTGRFCSPNRHHHSDLFCNEFWNFECLELLKNLLKLSSFPQSPFSFYWFLCGQIPETPNWLLSKNRPNDAQKSLQWFRGWVSADVVHDEFTKLQNSTACVSCAAHSMHCEHSKHVTFCDKMKELKQSRVLKPLILVIAMQFLMELNAVHIWRPYIIQVVKAYGIPWDANFTATILTSFSVIGNCCVLLSVKMFGKRRLYLISAMMVVCCCIGLSKSLNLCSVTMVSHLFLSWFYNKLLNYIPFHWHLRRCVRFHFLSTKLDIIRKSSRSKHSKFRWNS